MKTLPQVWVEYLEDQEETGMGYQIVDFTMKDNSVITDVLITNCEKIESVNRGNDTFNFNVNDIKLVNITHNKWK